MTQTHYEYRYDNEEHHLRRVQRVERAAQALLGPPGVSRAVERAFATPLRPNAEQRLTRLINRASVTSQEPVLAVGRIDDPVFVDASQPWRSTSTPVDLVATPERLLLGKGASFVSYRLQHAAAVYRRGDPGPIPYFPMRQEDVELVTIDGKLRWEHLMTSRQVYYPQQWPHGNPWFPDAVPVGAPWPEQENPGDAEFEAVWAFLLAATGAVEGPVAEATERPAGNSGMGLMGERPALRLIRSPRDAELTAAEWLDHFGFGPCRVTGLGSDEGVDVTSPVVVAQVKMSACSPIERTRGLTEATRLADLASAITTACSLSQTHQPQRTWTTLWDSRSRFSTGGS